MKKTGNQYGKINTKILIAIAVAAVVGIAAFFLSGGGDQSGRIKGDLQGYIEALRKGDFETIYAYNGIIQRRHTIQARSANKEQTLKTLYEESKASFDSVAPIYDLRAQWVEKFLFTPESSYTIKDVEMIEDKENPSQPLTERTNAVVHVEVQYPDKEKAPLIENTRLKSATYRVTMVHSKNISRVLRGSEAVKDKKWLYMMMQINQDTVKYWE